MSATEALKLAHTARCKLQLAADRPDRNLRFLLGHAVTLDKIRLRIAEVRVHTIPHAPSRGQAILTLRQIEEDDEVEEEEPVPSTARRVSFQSHRAPVSQQHISADRRRSPPPDQISHLSDTDSDEIELDDDDEDDLSLQRFGSSAAQPPRMIDDDESSSDEDDIEPKSPPPLSNEELEALTSGAGDEALTNSYRDLRGCHCHGNKESVPVASQVWEVPRKVGYNGPRLAVMQVEA